MVLITIKTCYSLPCGKCPKRVCCRWSNLRCFGLALKLAITHHMLTYRKVFCWCYLLCNKMGNSCETAYAILRFCHKFVNFFCQFFVNKSVKNSPQWGYLQQISYRCLSSKAASSLFGRPPTTDSTC